jgi:arylsulfatase A-like enzyme
MPNFLVRLVVVASVVLATGCAPGRRPTPNIVLITIDALRADSLSIAGHTRPTTPNLDNLARRGAYFSQAMTTFPGTTPAMPSLMTGLFPNFEVVDEWNPSTRSGFNEYETAEESQGPHLGSELEMLAEILASAGYTTLGFNTNPHLNRSSGFSQGFEEYVQFKDFLTAARAGRTHRLESASPPADVVIDRVVQRLAAGFESPIFLWVHFMEPHSPYLPPQPHRNMFVSGDEQFDDLEVNEALYHLRFEQRRAKNLGRDFRTPSDLGADLETLMQQARELYEAEIHFCDSQIERLLAQLDSTIGLENTLIVVTADHGEEFLEHGYVFHTFRNGMPEELIRIPLIIKPPRGWPARGRSDTLVRLNDIAPTVLDYAGMSDRAQHMEGQSLRPLVEGESQPPRDAYFSTPAFGVVRTARWKYRLDKRASGDDEQREALFDIVADPEELDNLIHEHPDVAASMRAKWDEFRAHLLQRGQAMAAVAHDAASYDDETRRRLESLGYVAE